MKVKCRLYLNCVGKRYVDIAFKMMKIKFLTLNFNF